MTATPKKTSPIGIFFRQVFPPMFMLPLFLTPWDNPLFVFWVICAFPALVALLLLLKSVSWRRKSATSGDDLPPLWKTRLGSLLTVGIFGSAAVTAFAVENASERYADELATQLQSTCSNGGRCPSAPEGWNIKGNIAETHHGHWKFTYIANAAQNEFILWVHQGYETEQCIHGGSKISLSKLNSVHCMSEPVSDPFIFRHTTEEQGDE